MGNKANNTEKGNTSMVISMNTLSRFFSKEEIREEINRINDAAPGSTFETTLEEDGKFNLMQTFFNAAKTPYVLVIQGDTAYWIKR